VGSLIELSVPLSFCLSFPGSVEGRNVTSCTISSHSFAKKVHQACSCVALSKSNIYCSVVIHILDCVGVINGR